MKYSKWQVILKSLNLKKSKLMKMLKHWWRRLRCICMILSLKTCWTSSCHLDKKWLYMRIRGTINLYLYVEHIMLIRNYYRPKLKNKLTFTFWTQITKLFTAVDSNQRAFSKSTQKLRVNTLLPSAIWKITLIQKKSLSFYIQDTI